MTREEWLKERLNGIGASEAASVIGKNPWKSNLELWEEKVGIRTQEDISHKDCVKYGTDAEAPLRELFKLDFPHWEIKYEDFDIRRNEDCPFILATLDGYIKDEDGRMGVLEIKTTEIRRANQKDKWQDGMPDNYYCQLLHQLLATGYDFAILKAQIKYYGELPRLEVRHYRIEKSEVQADLDFLLEKEVEFWELVRTKTKPALILPNL